MVRVHVEEELEESDVETMELEARELWRRWGSSVHELEHCQLDFSMFVVRSILNMDTEKRA